MENRNGMKRKSKLKNQHYERNNLVKRKHRNIWIELQIQHHQLHQQNEAEEKTKKNTLMKKLMQKYRMEER